MSIEKNADHTRTQGVCHCAKFHQCRICVTDFREGDNFASPLSMSSPEKAHPE